MNIYITGNPNGSTVVFFTGWPDNPSVFQENLMAPLLAQYRIVGITLPGFDHHGPILGKDAIKKRNGAPPYALKVPLFGYSFEELVDLFEVALLAAMDHRPMEQPMLIAHNWGCIVAFEFILSKPYFFSRVVMLDNGAPFRDPPDPDDRDRSNILVRFIKIMWFAPLDICALFHQLTVMVMFFIFPRSFSKMMLNFFLRLVGRVPYRYSITLSSNESNCNALLMVANMEKKKDSRQRCSFLSRITRVIFGGNEEHNEPAADFYHSRSFSRKKFYYAPDSQKQTLHLNPDAIAISYKCYPCKLIQHPSGDRRRGSQRISTPLQSVNGFDSINNANDGNTKEIVEEFDLVEPHPSWGWVYIRFWVLFVSRLHPRTLRFLMPMSMPVLFMYGADKFLLLHSPKWVEYVKAKGERDGSEVVPVPGGHWFFAESRHKEKVALRVAEFLNRGAYESIAG